MSTDAYLTVTKHRGSSSDPISEVQMRARQVSASSPVGKTLIQPSDLTYLGAWRTPNDSIGLYTQTAMCVRYVSGERRFLMVEFSGDASVPGDIVELRAPTNPTRYLGTPASDHSVDLQNAQPMREVRRWAHADWVDTSWINNITIPSAVGPRIGSLYWDDSSGLLWFACYHPYGTGTNYPIWGAVALLDSVKSGTTPPTLVYNVGARFGPWGYRSETYVGGLTGSESAWCRGQNVFIVPVPVDERSLIGGGKFLVGSGHQGQETDAAFGCNLHVVNDFNTAMAHPVPVVQPLCEYTAVATPLLGDANLHACRRDGTNYIAASDDGLTSFDKIGDDAPCGPYGAMVLGCAWIDTGTKHGVVQLVDEKNGYVGYWHYNPKSTDPYPTATDPTCRIRVPPAGILNGPKATQHYLGLRIFDPAHFAEVVARTRGPYASTVSSGEYAGLPGMRIAVEGNVWTDVVNGNYAPAQNASNLDLGVPANGDTGDATMVKVAGQDTDFQGVAWDSVAQELVWVQFKGWTYGHAFCFFSVS
jgi:hypothetical protein